MTQFRRSLNNVPRRYDRLYIWWVVFRWSYYEQYMELPRLTRESYIRNVYGGMGGYVMEGLLILACVLLISVGVLSVIVLLIGG